MDIQTVTISISTAILGASLAALYNKISAKEKIKSHITSIEFSTRLLSRVDQIELPNDIACKYREFSPWVIPNDGRLKPTSDFVPIGAAQEVHNYIKFFRPKCSAALEKANTAIDYASGKNDSIECIKTLLHDEMISGLIKGMAGRMEIQSSTLPETLPKPIFPYERKNQDNYKYFLVKLGEKNQTFLYNDEYGAKILEYCIASLCCGIKEEIKKIAEKLKEKIQNSLVLASDLDGWFDVNLDKNSTIIVSMHVANLGKLPVLINNSAAIDIRGLDGSVFSVPCISEDFAADTVSDKSANRIVRSYKEISQALDIPLNIRNKVPLDRTYIGPDSSTNISFRSCVPVSSMNNPDKLIAYYRTDENRASFSFKYTNAEGKDKAVVINNVIFGSNLDLAEKVANKALHSDR